MGIIQIIEDEPDHARLLELALRQARYRTNVAHDGWLGLADVQRLCPTLVLLDVMLPGLDGHEICRRLKADPQTCAVPVIMMSALGTADHRIKGLDLGVDDYVTKPFSPKEVVARVGAVLRRTRPPAVRTEAYLDGALVLEGSRYVVSVRGVAVELTGLEWRILRQLAKQAAGVVTREELTRSLWGDNDPVHHHELDRIVRGLDGKLQGESGGGFLIAVAPGCGYRLVVEP